MDLMLVSVQLGSGWIEKPVQNSVSVWWPAYLEAGTGKPPKYHTPPSHSFSPLHSNKRDRLPQIAGLVLGHSSYRNFCTIKKALP